MWLCLTSRYRDMESCVYPKVEKYQILGSMSLSAMACCSVRLEWQERKQALRLFSFTDLFFAPVVGHRNTESSQRGYVCEWNAGSQPQKRAKGFLGLLGLWKTQLSLDCHQAKLWAFLWQGISPHSRDKNCLGFQLFVFAWLLSARMDMLNTGLGKVATFCDPQRTSHSGWAYFPESGRWSFSA